MHEKPKDLVYELCESNHRLKESLAEVWEENSLLHKRIRKLEAERDERYTREQVAYTTKRLNVIIDDLYTQVARLQEDNAELRKALANQNSLIDETLKGFESEHNAWKERRRKE